MNKTELIAAVAEKTGLTKKDAERVVSATFETVTETIKKDEKVSISGFGIFEVKTRGRFVEDIDSLSGIFLGKFGSQFHTLAFSTR